MSALRGCGLKRIERSEDGAQGGQFRHLIEDVKQTGKGGGDVCKKISTPLFVAEESVSAKGLHEALSSAAPVDPIKIVAEGGF